MRDPDQFDAFYQAARHRLLVQTYALTGDLPAARSAVRAAFVAAWHHWRKVSRLEDPEGWVRPFAWAHAQRRHSTRIRTRDKRLAPELRATLVALGKLTGHQRKVLLLSRLTDATPDVIAREVGLTDGAAARQLAIAVADFAHLRQVEPADIRGQVLALEGRTSGTRFPRPSIVRRAGATRRRTHTTLGVAASVAALLVAGSVTAQGDGRAPGLDASRGGAQGQAARDEGPPRLHTRDLLTIPQVAGLAPTRTFTRTATHDGTVGSGRRVICQRERFADPAGVGALVRTFDSTGKPSLSLSQTMELSRSEAAARATYRRTIGWYAGCRDVRVQLLSTRSVTGAGDESTLLVLRGWTKPVTTYTIGVSRTGRITSSLVQQVAAERAPSLDPLVRLMSVAVGSLCDHRFAGACLGDVRAEPTPPPPAEAAPGMLQVVDLPPVSGVRHPWVGTSPTRPRRLNPAATTCDNADFSGRRITQAATRSFLIPQQRLPSRFGVSETLGRFPGRQAARGFVAEVRKRMDGCEDRDLASTVDLLHEHSTAASDMTVWRTTTEVSETRVVSFYMAIVRRGDVVIQVGFTPAAGAEMATGAFHDLSNRALERLAALPSPAP